MRIGTGSVFLVGHSWLGIVRNFLGIDWVLWTSVRGRDQLARNSINKWLLPAKC